MGTKTENYSADFDLLDAYSKAVIKSSDMVSPAVVLIKVRKAKVCRPLGSAFIAATGIGGNNNFTLSGIFYWSYAILLPIYFTFFYSRKRKKLFPETL